MQERDASRGAVAAGAGRGYHARAVTSEGARIPPHSDDAERAVLGALLLAPDRIADVAEQLSAEDFFSKRHKLLYECLQELSSRGVPIDFVSLGEAL